MKKILFILAAACVAALSLGILPFQSRGQGDGPAQVQDRKIAPQDILLIEVFAETNLTVERRVQATGTILYPLLKEVRAAGKTPGQLAAYIQEALDKDYLVDPQVSVTVKEYAKRTVNVTGEVTKPGAIELPGEQPWTIIDAIAQAGGMTKDAKAKVEFTRDGKMRTLNYEALTRETDPKKIIQLRPGDLIYVPSRIF